MRAFSAIVGLSAAGAAVVGAVALWVLGVDARPGLLGVLVLAGATVLALGSLARLRSMGDGDVLAGIRAANQSATALGAACVGAAISLPLFALHGTSVTDTDSTRILASVSFVARNGPGLVRRTQEPLLPHVLFRSAIELGGLPGARVVPIVGTMLLAAIVAGLAFQITHRLLGASVAAISIVAMATVMSSAVELPLYEFALAFGYLAGYCTLRALRADTRRQCVIFAIAAAVALALAFETQGTAQLFIAAPGIVFVCFATPATSRRAIRGVLWVYGLTAIALIPRVLLNFSVGGLDHVTTSRNEFMVTRGYLDIVNQEFWKNPVGIPFFSYLGHLPRVLSDAIGLGVGSVAIGSLVVIAAVNSGWRSRAFALLASGLLAAALARAQPPPFPRYASPILPGIALAAAVGAVWIARRGGLWRSVAIGITALLAVTGLWNLRSTASRFQLARRTFLTSSAAAQIRPYITDKRGVIGARASALHGVDPHIVTYGASFLTELEWKKFLLWPSDEIVLAVLRKHDIGWVDVSENVFYEVAYNNTWTVPAYGAPVRAQLALMVSKNFCRRWTSGFAALYEVGPCIPGAGAPGT